METIDDGGNWWLPEAPDGTVPGWLTFEVGEGARLRLIGSLHDIRDHGVQGDDGSIETTGEAFERAGTYPRILGQIRGTAFTLEGCFQIRLDHQLSGGLPTETIHVDRIYRGVWYEPDEEACGDRIAVRLAHLVYWIMPAALEETWPKSVEDGKAVVELAGAKLPSIVVGRPTGTMKIVQRLGVNGDQVALRSITQDFEARFDTADVRTWSELAGAIWQFQDVVSLAMDRVACIEAMSLFHPNVVHERPEGPAYRLPIEMFAEWTDRTAWVEPKYLSPREVLFHYDVVGEDGLARLLDAAGKYRAELRSVIATRKGRMAYSSDRLLTCSAALESFDRRRLGRERRSFKKRVSACVSLAGEPFARLVEDAEGWLEVLERRRNHAAHHLESDDEDAGFTDVLMGDSAYLLFALCFLREASMPPKVFELAERNVRVDWLRRQLPAVIAEYHRSPR